MMALNLLIYLISLAPALCYFGNKTSVKFDRSCLRQDQLTFTHEKQ